MVIAVDWLPFSLIENIHITTFQCWLLMFVIVMMILTIQKKNYRYFLYGSSFVVLFVIAQWIHFVTDTAASKITVYKISGHSAMDLIGDGRAYFHGDSAIRSDAKKIRFHITPNRLSSGVTGMVSDLPDRQVRPVPGGKLIVWQQKKILYVTSDQFQPNIIFIPDLIVVANNAIRDASTLVEIYPQAEIVFDSSNNYYYVDRILKNSKENSHLFSVQHQGAFEFKIETNT
jgi:competence protein ComEC